jgi:iron complex outermembrane receptor protein
VKVPTFIGAALFEQKKKREGGAFDIEAKPTRDLGIDLNGFYSKLKRRTRTPTGWPRRPTRSTART